MAAGEWMDDGWVMHGERWEVWCGGQVVGGWVMGEGCWWVACGWGVVDGEVWWAVGGPTPTAHHHYYDP